MNVWLSIGEGRKIEEGERERRSRQTGESELLDFFATSGLVRVILLQFMSNVSGVLPGVHLSTAVYSK